MQILFFWHFLTLWTYLYLGFFPCTQIHILPYQSFYGVHIYCRSKICTKHRKHWKSYVIFQLSGKTRPFLAVLKVSTFCYSMLVLRMFYFFHFFMGKIGTKLVFLHIAASALKIQLKKTNFHFKMYLFYQNRLKFTCEKEKLPGFLYLVLCLATDGTRQQWFWIDITTKRHNCSLCSRNISKLHIIFLDITKIYQHFFSRIYYAKYIHQCQKIQKNYKT